MKVPGNYSLQVMISFFLDHVSWLFVLPVSVPVFIFIFYIYVISLSFT